MAAIVSGNSLGLELTSLATLGGQTWSSEGRVGRSGEQVLVNAATGNLILQNQDEFLASRGTDLPAVRTYNSLGELSDDNADNWIVFAYGQKVTLTSGTRNKAGSILTRVGADGAKSTYVWDASGSRYRSFDGEGAADTIVYNASTNRYERRDGSTGRVEEFDAATTGATSGRLLRLTDPDGATSTLSYANGQLSKVVDASNETMFFDYVGSRLTALRTETNVGGVTGQTTRVRYGYDSAGRLQTVTVDLSPADGSIADGNVYTTTYTYDGTSKRVASLTQSDGSTVGFKYELVGSSYRIKQITDTLGAVTTFGYDTALRRTTVEDETSGKVWTYDYDAAGQLTKVTAPAVDGNAFTQSFGYDASGNVTSLTNADGEKVTLQYDGNGNCTLRRDALGNTVRWTFGAANQVLTETTSSLPVAPLQGSSGMTVTVDGTASKTDGSYAWNTSVRSRVGYTGAATASFSPASQLSMMIGLTTDPQADDGYASIDWALHCRSDGTLCAYENGTKVDLRESSDASSPLATYSAGDTLRVRYDGEAITYLRNGKILRTVAVAIAKPLYLDSSFYSPGASATDLRFGNAVGGDATTRYVYAAGQPTQLRFVISPGGRVTENLYDPANGQLVQVRRYEQSQYDFNAESASPNEASMAAWAGRLGPSTPIGREDLATVRGRVVSRTEYATATAGGSTSGPRVTRYLYDPSGRLIKQYGEAGGSGDEAGIGTRLFTYDGLGRLLTETAENGAVTTTIYADSERKTTIRYDNGASITSAYDKRGRLLSMQRSDGDGLTRYAYDDEGRLLMTTLPNGVRQYRLYDEIGRHVADVDGNGTLSRRIYDRAGRVIQQITYQTAVPLSMMVDSVTERPKNPSLASIIPDSDPLDLRSWQVWDDSGRLAYRIADNGAVTEYGYDGAGRLVRTTAYAVSVILSGTPTVASMRALLAEPDIQAGAARDRVTRQFYNVDGLLAGTLDGEGYLTTFTYDYAGRLVATRRRGTAVDASIRLTGALDQLLPPSSPDDQVETTFYDAAGRRIAQVDAEGYLTRTTYSDRGEVRSVIRYSTALATAPSWQADPDALLASIRPGGTAWASDRQTTNHYALDGRLIEQTDFEGTSTTFRYDRLGRLVQTTRGAGLDEARSVRARFDDWGRKTAELSAEAAALITPGMTAAQIDAVWNAHATQYTYNAADQLVREVGPTGITTIRYYNDDGQLALVLKAIDPDDPQGLAEAERKTYNALGQVTSTIRYATRVPAANRTGGRLATSTITDTLASIADPSKDSVTRTTYDAVGRLLTITDAEGHTTTIGYTLFNQERDRRTDLGNGRTRFDTISYDRRGFAVRTVRDAEGIAAEASTVYDAFGRAMQSTDANGHTRWRTWDRLGREVSMEDATHRERNTTYNAFDQVLRIDDASGRITYAYDRADRRVTMTTAEGVVVQTTHNAFGETETVLTGAVAAGTTGTVAGVSVTTTYRYDRDGHLVRTERNGARIESRTYDDNGWLERVTDANGVPVTYTYDAAGRMLTRTLQPANASTEADELDLTTTWKYDAKGQAYEVTDPRGTVTRITFDLAGRRTSQIVDVGGLALRTDWEYDAEGRVLTVTDPERVKTETSFDTAGRRTREVRDPGGLAITRRWEYDTAGNVTNAFDPRNNVTRYQYDAENRILWSADPAGSVTHYEYDDAGRLRATERYFDPIEEDETLGNVDSSAQKVTTRTYYDADGRLQASVDGAGGVVLYTYDGNGRVDTETRCANPIAADIDPTASPPAANSRDQVTRFEYDAAGRETWRANDLGEVTRSEYDANGNLVRRTRFANRLANTSARPSSVSASSADRIERFIYDAAGRETWRSDATGAVTRTAYNGNGDVVKVTRYANRTTGEPDSVVASTNDRVTSHQYDRGGRCRWTVDPLGQVTGRTHDRNGNVLSSTLYLDAPASRDEPWTVVEDPVRDLKESTRYDSAGRVESHTVAGIGTETFTYDDAGNRKSRTDRNGARWDYTYDPAGRLLSELSPEVPLYSVDASSGSLVLRQETAARIRTGYVYDALGRMTARTEAEGLPEARTTTYKYDEAGRQIEVTEARVGVYAESSAALATNDRSGEAARVETRTSPTTRTVYDAFGNAIAVTGRNGATSFTSYDAAGRKTFEVDALGYVTGYDRNAFGEVITTTRYATATTLNEAAPADAARRITTTQVDAAVHAAGLDHALDQVTGSTYDKAGRLQQTTDAAVFTYDSDVLDKEYVGDEAGVRTTRYSYNAFGELSKVAELEDADANAGAGKWAETFHYYDLGGRRSATVDAMGYLSEWDYDASGHQTSQIESYSPLAEGDWNLSSHKSPDPKADDRNRTTRWTWDALGRKLSETQVDVLYSTDASGTRERGDVTTRHAYDGVGNLVRTIDANDRITRTYYDALGRVRAIVSPSRSTTIDGASVTPLVELRRDALGNVVGRIERARGAAEATEAGYTANIDDANDHITRTAYDAAGRATRSDDALRNAVYFSYTADGQIAKTWRTVTDADNDAGERTQVLYTAYEYDAIGRISTLRQPSTLNPDSAVAIRHEYDAFGHLVSKRRSGSMEAETYEYDRAGRLWRTNRDDGEAKVYLYDLRGRMTAEIRSAGNGREGAPDVADGASAAGIAAWGRTRRVELHYNRIGQVVRREEAERLLVEGGVTVRKATANAKTTSSAHLEGSGSTTQSGNGNPGDPYRAEGQNQIDLSWATLAYLGSGEVRVDVTYLTADTRTTAEDPYSHRVDYTGYGHESVSRELSFSDRGDLWATGAKLLWADDSVDVKLGICGVDRVTSFRVYKKNTYGNWVKVVDRDEAAFGSLGSQIEIGSPVDPKTAVQFKYRLVGSKGEWTTVALTRFGDSHWFDASTLVSGKQYEYQVWLTPQDGTAEQSEGGTFTFGNNDTDDGKDEVWQRPTIVTTRDRWGNVLTQSDPRNATWLTRYTYDHANRVIEETRPDPSTGNISAASPRRSFYYDRLGRQLAMRDERDNVNGQLWDSGGHLVTEVHADGGRVTHAYDAFGQRVRTIDAIGNAGTGRTVTDHTTLYDYDAMGRLITTTHGSTASGSVEVWSIDGEMKITSTEWRNLTERFTYDEAGRLLTQINGASNITRHSYDRMGNLVATTKPGGTATTRWSYDYAGRKIREEQADGSFSTWTYDDFGKLHGHMDLGGAKYQYAYDDAGQLTSQTNSRGQKLLYAYDAAGQLLQIDDQGTGKLTTTAYDLAGLRLREKVTQRSVTKEPDGSTRTTQEVLQDNHLAYDTLGRLVDSADNRVHLTFSYDAAGNRTYISSHAWIDTVASDDEESVLDAKRYFLYDAMNRQTRVDAVDDKGTISTAQGHRLTYDLNGNRIEDTFWANRVIAAPPMSGREFDSERALVSETYTYDAVGRLRRTDRDDLLLDLRRYDGAGRVLQSGAPSLDDDYAFELNKGLDQELQLGLQVRRQRYAADGRLLQQTVMRRNDEQDRQYDLVYAGLSLDEVTQLGYDAAGNVQAYEMRYREGADYTNTTVVDTARYEGYVQTRTHTTSTKTGLEDGTAVQTYDVNGHLNGVDDINENSLDKSVATDSAGRILRVTQDGHALYTHVVNGEIFGRHGVGPDAVKPRDASGEANFSSQARFEFGYRKISGSYPAAGTGQYTVSAGEDLRSIAQQAYGDSRLWWRIAQANGLQSESDLRVGQSLTLPSVVAGNSNDTQTFQPYDSGAILGDISPHLPMPQNDGGCGAVGQILMIVVAAVVTFYTAGAAAAWLAPAGSTAAGMSAGAVATAIATGGATSIGISTGTLMAAAAIGGAAGSVAGQLVGMATGNVQNFSWKQVAMSAVGSGISAGVGNLAGSSPIFNTAFSRAAISSTVTQGIGVATGLQDHFSWRQVAASAVGSEVGEGIGSSISATQFGQYIGSTASRGIGNYVGQISGQAISGQRVDAQALATTAIANALGQGLVDQMRNPSAAENRSALDKENVKADQDYHGSGSASTESARLTVSQQTTLALGRGPLTASAAQKVVEGLPSAGYQWTFADDTGLRSEQSTQQFNRSVATPAAGSTGPFIDFGGVDRAVLAGSYGADYSSFRQGTYDDGTQWVEQTYHRGFLTRMDEGLQSAQEAVDAFVQRTQDEGAAAYARGDKVSAAMAAISYLPDRLVGDTLKGIVGLPRLYTNNHMLPALMNAAVNPLHTLSAGYAAFSGMSTSDKIISAVELLGPTALKVGPGMISRLNSAPTLGTVENTAASRIAELQAKWGNLTAAERRALLESKSEATWGIWLDQRDAVAKAVNPNTHFLEKHGPSTTLLAQEIRASTKLAPDGSIDPSFRDSSRFLSNRDMGAAMQRADSIFQLNGRVNKAYSFTMEGLIGEGYTKAPDLTWMFTTNVNGVYRNGQPYTVFPLLRPIQ